MSDLLNDSIKMGGQTSLKKDFRVVFFNCPKVGAKTSPVPFGFSKQRSRNSVSVERDLPDPSQVSTLGFPIFIRGVDYTFSAARLVVTPSATFAAWLGIVLYHIKPA